MYVLVKGPHFVAKRDEIATVGEYHPATSIAKVMVFPSVDEAQQYVRAHPNHLKGFSVVELVEFDSRCLRTYLDNMGTAERRQLVTAYRGPFN